MTQHTTSLCKMKWPRIHSSRVLPTADNWFKWNSQAQVAGGSSVHLLFRPDELHILIKVSVILQERADLALVMSFLRWRGSRAEV